MTYQDPYLPPYPPKKRRVWPWVIIGLFVAALCALGGIALIGAAGEKSTGLGSTHTPTPMAAPTTTVPTTPPTTESDPVAAAAPEPPQTFGEGTYQVTKKSSPDDGTIKAGTFVLITPDHCYWERLKGFSGDFDEIITNGNLDASGDKPAQARVTIKKSDKGFALSGDCILGQKGGLK